MKRRLFPLGALVGVASVLLIVACGSPASAPSPASSGANPPAGQPTAAAQKAAGSTITLKMSHHEPSTSLVNTAFQKWADQINQKTNGQVTIKVYDSETLAKGKDIVTSVQTGITDIGWVIIGFFPGQFPLTEVYNLPVLGVKSSAAGAQAEWDLYQNNPDVQKEWSSVKVLGFTSSGSQWISASKKPVRTIDDVKGLKLRVSGWGGTELFKSLGASPMNVAPPDMYENISKGILDGMVFDWQGINSSRLFEVVNYASTYPIIMQPQAVIMNKDKWNSLSPDIQKAIMDVSGPSLGKLEGDEAFDKADQQGIDNFKKLNKEIINFSPEEQKKWQDAAKPVWQGWVKQVKDKGLDGQKALDQIQEAINKYNKQ